MAEDNSYLNSLYREASYSGNCHQIRIRFEENSHIVRYAEYFADDRSNKAYLVVKGKDANNFAKIKILSPIQGERK